MENINFSFEVFNLKYFGQDSFLCYVLARSLSFLWPRKMFNADVCVKRLKQCISIFGQVRHWQIRLSFSTLNLFICINGNPNFKISIFLKTESINFSSKKWQYQGFLIRGCDFASPGTGFRRKSVFN